MESAPDIIALNDEIKNESAFIDLIKNELQKVIVGQKGMVEGLLIGLLADGHILLEGVPGLAKTLAINSLSKTIGGSFSRVQFTPDLLPSDVVGPIFSNFVLADEINRAPAKVQSALLEAMQERQVTLGDESFPLPVPFLVMATQNPIEQEGTYPLPEAQMDRFLLKITLGYPQKEEERTIMRKQMTGAFEKLNAVVGLEQILKARNAVERIYMDEKIESYILDKAAKCHAFLRHRGFVTPEDVRAIAPAVLRHRIGLTYEAEAEEITSETIITEILNTLMVP
jgi:MoxR-like ATPase